MTKNSYTGQPGNAVPVEGMASSNSLAMGMQLGFRRPHVTVSSDAYTVSATETGSIFTYGGVGSAITITLCPPEPGLWFEFACTGAVAAAGTVFTATGTDVFIHCGKNGTSEGVSTITPISTKGEFTVLGGGYYVEIIGLSTTNYLFKSWVGGASVASTEYGAGSSGA